MLKLNKSNKKWLAGFRQAINMYFKLKYTA